MKVYGLTVDEVRHTVEWQSHLFDHNLIVRDIRDQSNSAGPRVTVTLRVKDSDGPGAQRSASGRRTVSACWHAHRNVIQGLFMNGAERVQSFMADYRSEQEFRDLFPDTYYTEVGSLMNPVMFGELCDCERNK